MDAGVAVRSKANMMSTTTVSSFPDLFTLEYEDYIYIYAFSRHFYPKRLTVH